jgi:hypothetical protein
MNCIQCEDLRRTFESAHIKYVAARSAEFYQVSTEIAAKKQVDMERARIDLQEHQATCSRLGADNPFRTFSRFHDEIGSVRPS